VTDDSLTASLEALVDLGRRDPACAPAIAWLEADARLQRRRRDVVIRSIWARFFSRSSIRIASREIAKALARRAERHRRLERAGMAAADAADPFDAALDRAIEASGGRPPGQDMIRRLLSEKWAMAT
jgi:hypothetical protein